MTLDLTGWWRLPGFDSDLRPLDLYAPQHVGLYLDRCLPLPYLYDPKDGYSDRARKALKDGKAHRVAAYESAIAALRPRFKTQAILTYRACYERWRVALSKEALLRTVRVIELESTARLLLHPSANQSITDGAVLMHHTYGAPYLPGSGLKGLARAQARRDGHPDKVIRALFGNDREPKPFEDAAENPDQAALVRFLDALWIPEAPKGAPDAWSALELDVITPHHSDYYTKDQPPGDWQQPVPTQRLTVSPGARFCVILEGCPGPKEQVEEWLTLAEQLLVAAAAELGFGAYTRAGFGRMTRVGESKTSAGGAEEVTQKLPWQSVFISRNPGSGVLTLTLLEQGNKKAVTSGDQGRALLDTLPTARRQQLTRQNQMKGEAQIDAQGVGLRVVALR
jgi:CRISPR type III-B/RAMP module RAMP protein Cmr6